MAMTARFQTAVTSPRPFKSHRYDVFGLKVNRMLTIFGRDQLEAWLLLEADPNVAQYCERPLYVPDHKPKRVVDFWAGFRDCNELWLVENKPVPDDANEGALAALRAWAEPHAFKVRQVAPHTANRTFLNNWGMIVRDLSANRRYIGPPLVSAVRACLEYPRPLSAICAMLRDHDQVLVRSAIYSLLHLGVIHCPDLAKEPLGPASTMEPV
jgi:hypothetical protein